MGNRPPADDTFVVVVGASAGGIDALRRLAAGLPAGFPAPVVVAQHVAADRTSRLTAILESAGPLPVVSVTGPTMLEPGRIYVAPGHEHVRVTDHQVDLEPAEATQAAPSVDRLLTTASEALGDRLIAIILSGMGSDGTSGAREVRARGGIVIIQDPETAAFPSMPQSLPPTLVDFISPPDELGGLLTELVSEHLAAAGRQDDRLLRAFLDQVRERTGMDFSAYKRPTILRRLQRRIVATHTGTLRGYVRFAQSHPEEFQRLASTFLIKVTQFFRDPELYDYLRLTLMPRLVEEARQRDREIRVWSAGCATGEEAYSLAILASEVLGDELEDFTVRIFATDLDEDAIAFARRGIYPRGSLAGLPPELVSRYFHPVGEDAEVSKRIRGMVVFGQHDLGQRAPFPRIDLALCRNVLIYFTTELQKRALHLFAFSLREGGFLVLGKSESTTPLAEHFVLEQPRLKVYRRAGERVLIPTPRIRDALPASTRVQARREPIWAVASPPLATRDRSPASERPEHLILKLPVGVVVVNERYDITLINAAARRLLAIHGPAVGHDLVHLARGVPSEEVRPRLDDALRGRSSELVVRLPPGAVQAPDGDEVVSIMFTPLRPSDDAVVDRVLITIADITRPSNELREVNLQLERTRVDAERIRHRLDAALRANGDLLQANEELTNTNALLRTANEELLVTTEEVQAATEEVETLNEELQATNEELETLNEELQATNEELNTTNDDLEARSAELQEVAASLQEQRTQSELERVKLSLILDSMTDAVMVVDPSGAIAATNRAYDAMFGGPTASWTPEDDSGRALPADQWPRARAARSEAFTMLFSVRRPDGTRRWYEAASRGEAQPDWPSVVVIRDITDRSLRALQERFMAAAGHELRTPVAALHGFLQLLERELQGAPPEVRGRLDQAQAETRLLGDLVTRLFDIALIQQGRLAIRHDVVDLSHLVEDVAAAVGALHPEARIELGIDDGLLVAGDLLRLRQVMMNLALNAVVHGGPKDVEVVARRRDPNHVAVEVRDRGRGLPSHVRRHLFEPFVVDGSGSTAGLGLGLYLAREIVAAHRGSIVLEDRPGGGTVARVELEASQRRPRKRRGT